MRSSFIFTLVNNYCFIDFLQVMRFCSSLWLNNTPLSFTFLYLFYSLFWYHSSEMSLKLNIVSPWYKVLPYVLFLSPLCLPVSVIFMFLTYILPQVDQDFSLSFCPLSLLLFSWNLLIFYLLWFTVMLCHLSFLYYINVIYISNILY